MTGAWWMSGDCRHVTVWCRCGRAFDRTERGWIKHPEPWCKWMVNGQETPSREKLETGS